MLAVQLVHLLQQIILKVRLDDILIKRLLTLLVLLVEHVAEGVDLIDADREEWLEVLRDQAGTRIKSLELALETVIAVTSRQTALR